MNRLFRLLLVVLATCAAYLSHPLAATADELTVVSLTSNANDGIILTFSQDVRVSHNSFGQKCFNALNDNNASVRTLNATPHTQGNVVTLVASWCNFVNGHNMYLELNPECFTTLDGETHLTGTTSFNFIMGDGADSEPITAVQVAPANGTLTHLGNIAVVFDPKISGILDPAGFTVTNENGDALPILSVIVDKETPIPALNVNVDTERAELQGGTTYSLHIAPGALLCGTITNEKELVYGKWYVKPQPLVLVTDPPHQRMLPEITEVTVSAENGGRIACTDLKTQNLRLTGIMDDQSIVLANVTKITPDRSGSSITLTLDRPVNAQTLRAAGAIYDYVKLSIPEGLFRQGTKMVNDACQMVWKIGTPKPLGDVTWSFSPAPGSTLPSLGNVLSVEQRDGETTEVYTLRFNISGQNAYVTINDAQDIKIVNRNTGAVAKTFSRTDLKQDGINSFMLVMASPVTEDGLYSLVIPAANVNYYSDVEHYSAPQHPLSDVVATWRVYNADAPIAGDASGDGAVTVSDLVLTIDHLRHPATSTVIVKNADCNADGRVNITDLQAIARKVLGQE